MNYQFFDWECYRYDLYQAEGIGNLRGPDPRPLRPGGYMTAIGAAQTFGRFVDNPFTHQLRRATGMRMFDLSTSAVAPAYFTTHGQIMDIINNSALCVVQMTAARSCGNSVYNNEKGHKNIFRKTAEGEDSRFYNEHEIYEDLWKAGKIDEAKQLIEESKQTWITETRELLDAIKVPKVLLWLSSRTPEYTPNPVNYSSYAGEFPQYVDRPLVEAVKGAADDYVEAISREGLPIPFKNRFTGETGQCYFGTSYRTSHGYYPSQAMHDLAFEKLKPVVERLIGDKLRHAANDGPSPHEIMIETAQRYVENGRSRYASPFALTTVFQQLVAHFLWRGAASEVTFYGQVDPLLKELLATLKVESVGARDEKPLQTFVMLGDDITDLPGQGVSERPDGMVWICGAAGDNGKPALVKAVAQRWGMRPVGIFDDDVLMAGNNLWGPVRQRINSALRQRMNPSWKPGGENEYLGWGGVNSYQGRSNADYSLDHAKIVAEHGS